MGSSNRIWVEHMQEKCPVPTYCIIYLAPSFSFSFLFRATPISTQVLLLALYSKLLWQCLRNNRGCQELNLGYSYVRQVPICCTNSLAPSLSLLLFCLWAILNITQGLLLSLHSIIIPGVTQGTLWGTHKGVTLWGTHKVNPS